MIIFFLELLLLFVLSQMLTKSLSIFIHKTTRSMKAVVAGISVIFFPGTVVHEFSHAVTASILQVPVGHIEFLPKLHGESLKMGSVQVGQSDVVRKFFIGIAPFFVGVILLLIILWSINAFNLLQNVPIFILSLYGIFTISNTMFSSKKDMEGAVEFFLLIGIILVILYFLGIPVLEIGTVVVTHSTLESVFMLGSKLLLIPVIIDVILIGIFQYFIRR